MKTTFVTAFIFLSACAASAQETPASFFANDPALQSKPSAPAESETPRMAQATRSTRITPPTSSVMALVDNAARKYGVPINIARATVNHESKGRCNARGRAGELGPLQIKPSTARGLGYTGPASALATCGAGLEWGMRHLALAYKKCGHVGPHQGGLGSSCARTAYVRKVMGRA